MDANTYQQEARRTLIDRPDREIPLDELQLVWAALQIAITAGQLVEHLKKGIFHQHGVDGYFIMDKIDTIKELATMPDAPLIPNLSGEEVMKLWVLSGLIGEASEIGEKILAGLEEGKEPEGLQDEGGDIMWYVASFLTQHDILLGDTLEGNVDKLLGPNGRYKQGYYSSEASKNRQE